MSRCGIPGCGCGGRKSVSSILDRLDALTPKTDNKQAEVGCTTPATTEPVPQTPPPKPEESK